MVSYLMLIVRVSVTLKLSETSLAQTQAALSNWQIEQESVYHFQRILSLEHLIQQIAMSIAGSFSWFLTDNYGIRGAWVSSFFNEGTTIINNSVGTDKSGSSALGNSSVGILLRGDLMVILQAILYQVTIYLVFVYEQPIIAVVQGNFIGTDIPGRYRSQCQCWHRA